MTRKDHFSLSFINQVLENLARNEYFCFLDGYLGYTQINVASENQSKTTFMLPYGIFAYRRMPFGLYNPPGTFQCCMMSIFSNLLEKSIEVFMDDFKVYGKDFDTCLGNLKHVLQRCVDKNLVLNYEKCHFTVKEGIFLVHVVSGRGIKVDKEKGWHHNQIALPDFNQVTKGFPWVCWILPPVCQGFCKDRTMHGKPIHLVGYGIRV